MDFTYDSYSVENDINDVIFCVVADSNQNRV